MPTALEPIVNFLGFIVGLFELLCQQTQSALIVFKLQTITAFDGGLIK